MKVFVKGIGFDNTTPDAAAQKVVTLVDRGGAAYVVTPNTEIIARAKNKEFYKVLINADMVLPDGIGVCAMSLAKGRLLKRTTGIDLAYRLLEKCADTGLSLFLYGAKAEVLQRALRNLERDYPTLLIAGACDGYNDERAALEMILSSDANVVFVCTSSPKQEFFAQKAAMCAQGKVFIALGGVIDILSGDKKRAPKIFQKLGLEWAYRFSKEPWRIKRFLTNVFGVKNLPNNH